MSCVSADVGGDVHGDLAGHAALGGQGSATNCCMYSLISLSYPCRHKIGFFSLDKHKPALNSAGMRLGLFHELPATHCMQADNLCPHTAGMEGGQALRNKTAAVAREICGSTERRRGGTQRPSHARPGSQGPRQGCQSNFHTGLLHTRVLSMHIDPHRQILLHCCSPTCHAHLPRALCLALLPDL